MSTPATSTLRLTQTAEGDDRYRVDITLENDRGPRQTATTCFSFAIGAAERERLRWYLEDYLQYPDDPAPKLAGEVEEWMAGVGRTLFGHAFESSRDAERIWARIYDRLPDIRVEIVATVREAAAIPWELLRDPQTDAPL